MQHTHVCRYMCGAGRYVCASVVQRTSDTPCTVSRLETSLRGQNAEEV